jgi:osmotically-inducible protein OsmY
MKQRILLVLSLVTLAIGPALGLSGCSATSTGKSTGEYIDDAAITTKVKAEFVRDPIVSALQVKVATFKGVVQLGGFVDTPEQKMRAEQIVRNMPGIAGVQNSITIKAPVVR